MVDRKELIAQFARRHRQPGIVVLPNAWDVASAIMMAEAGFPAIATTSAGIAFVLGYPDGQRIGRERMLAHVAAIAEAVPVPVSADLEAGYGPRPEDVATTVREALAVGLAGCNIEDSGVGDDGRSALFDIGLACERIRAGAEAIRDTGRPFVLNARVDPYLVGFGSESANFEEAVNRANAYLAAGADCVFVPGPMDAATIGRLVQDIRGPLNVLGARAGMPSTLTVADLEQLGVRRVSIGGSLTLAMLGFVQQSLRELAQSGTFTYSQSALRHPAIDALMADYRARAAAKT